MGFNIGDKVRVVSCRSWYRGHRCRCGQVGVITALEYTYNGINYYIDGKPGSIPENLLQLESDNGKFSLKIGDYVRISGDHYIGGYEYNGEYGTITDIDDIGMCTVRIDESEKWTKRFWDRPAKVPIHNLELAVCLTCLHPCHGSTYLPDRDWQGYYKW